MNTSTSRYISTLNRDAHGTFFAPPAVVDTLTNGFTGNPGEFGPFRNQHGATLRSNNTTIALIDALIWHGCPTDVSRLVMSVYIYAIKAMVRGRSWSNRSQKLVKRCESKFNTTATVIREVVTRRVRAAIFRTTKGLVFGHRGRSVASETPVAAILDVRHFDLLNRLKCLGSSALFIPARRAVLILTFIGITGAAFSVHAQCVSTPTDPCTAVHQSILDRAAKAVDELTDARKVIAAFQNERGATEQERAAYKNALTIADQAIEVFKKGVADRDRVIELQGKALELYSQLVEKLQAQINKPKSAWQKFVGVLEKVIVLTAGITIGRGL